MSVWVERIRANIVTIATLLIVAVAIMNMTGWRHVPVVRRTMFGLDMLVMSLLIWNWWTKRREQA